MNGTTGAPTPGPGLNPGSPCRGTSHLSIVPRLLALQASVQGEISSFLTSQKIQLGGFHLEKVIF